MSKGYLEESLGIKYPIIMAPMFLVSNLKMLSAAYDSGIIGAIPALNFRSIKDFERGLEDLETACGEYFGINLIVNKSNLLYPRQLEATLKSKAKFIITSLGNPKNVIEKAHKKDKKVFCDVVDEEHALKVESLGADAMIAVNSKAGGHAGPLAPDLLIPKLTKACSIPVISAGGVGDHLGLTKILELGAVGASIGTIFIASEESDVSSEYKMACVKYGRDDIVLTDKISGTPCTVINTDYVKKIGVKQNVVERFLSKNKLFKKYIKLITSIRGMGKIRKAAFKATYKTLWCAGPAIEYVMAIRSVKEIVNSLLEEKG